MTGRSRKETPGTVFGERRPEVLGFGAECIGDALRFRLWAPKPSTVEVVLSSAPHEPLPMVRSADGWFELTTRRARAGSCYRYRIDGGLLVPDPASRFQPDDVHGPSEVIDPAGFVWSDGGWRGRPWEEAVVYELHIGTFSPEGTYRGAARLLPRLADLGVTAIEIMPLADFPGRRNWGYDGVLPFAPDSVYGRPEDLKSLIQIAHGLGLMVFMDVVYNHFGPDGNYIAQYAPQFFTDRHKTPWGQAINFDGEGSREVRAYFVANARYWLSEYHCDGLRFDAVHAIVDDSSPHIVQELALAISDLRSGGRFIHLILENEENTASYLQHDDVRYVHTAQWNDDIHHVLHCLLTDETSGYYADYAQRARAFRTLSHGRICLSGGAVALPGHAPRTGLEGLSAHGLCVVFAESRSDRKPGVRGAYHRACPATSGSIGHGDSFVGAVAAAALYGAGVRVREAVSVFLRFRGRFGPGRDRRTAARIRTLPGV